MHHKIKLWMRLSIPRDFDLNHFKIELHSIDKVKLKLGLLEPFVNIIIITILFYSATITI